MRRIDEEPGEIPAALEGLATNPDNLLLFTSLVVSTVFVAQLSSFVLFGSSLSAPLQQSEDGEEPSNDGFGGIMKMLMDAISAIPNAPSVLADLINQIGQMVSGDEVSEDTEASEAAMADDGMESAEGSADGGSEESEPQGSNFLEGVIQFLTDLIPQIPGSDSSDEKEGELGDFEMSGSGDAEDDEEEEGDEDDALFTVGVDVPSGGPLEMIIKLFEGSDEREDGVTQMPGEETTTKDPSDLGSSIGDFSISLQPIDLANLFVQVLKAPPSNRLQRHVALSSWL